jgi:transcriptional regulator with XRE-family HTH domain
MRSEIRRRADLTLLQVSNATGIRMSALSEWERGDRRLTDEQMRAIARVLAENLKQVPVFGGPDELLRVLANPNAAVAA